MPSPINSIKTRVIQTEEGFEAQATIDGLSWFNLPEPDGLMELGDYKYLAMRVAIRGNQIPVEGTVVWTSDDK